MRVNSSTAKGIFEIIHQSISVTQNDLQSSNKTKNIVYARNIFGYVMRELGYSYSNIGMLINKNHATIMLGIRRLKPKDIDTAKEIINIIKRQNLPSLMINQQKDIDSNLETIKKIHKNKSEKWNWLFKKYKAVCQVCMIEDIVEVHHIIALKNGGSNHPSNLLILCPNHHFMLHNGYLFINKIPDKIEINSPIINNHTNTTKEIL